MIAKAALLCVIGRFRELAKTAGRLPERQRLWANAWLEPVAAVRDPPCNENDWDGRGDAPPQWKEDVRQ